MFDLLKSGYSKAKISSRLLYFTYTCLFISALTQCVALGAGNIFLVLAVILSFIYAYYHFDLVKKRVKRYRVVLLFYLFFLICVLPSVFFSPDLAFSSARFVRLFLYRSSPFLIVLLICPQAKFTLSLLLLSLFSFFITSLGGLFILNDQTWRISGLYGHQMTLAGFLCLIGPLVFTLLYKRPVEERRYYLYISIFIYTVFIALMNGTRGAWIALFICLLITGIWYSFRSKRNILILGVLCIGIVISIGSSPRLSDRLASVGDTQMSSNAERIVMWKTALRMWEDHKLTGVGYNRFKDVYRNEYVVKNSPESKYSHPHNNLLYLLADSGFFGFLGYCIFFGYILVYSFIRLIKNKNIYDLLIFTTTLSLHLQGLTEYNFGNQAVIKFYWLLLGCYMTLSSKRIKELPL